MPKTCVVPGCMSRKPSHQFPKNCTRLREWQLAINSSQLYSLTEKELTIGRSYCVCHLHFPPEAYEKTKWPGHRRLKQGAVPTLHINPPTTSSPDIHNSSIMPIDDEELVDENEKAGSVSHSASKKSKKQKKSHKSKSAKKNGTKSGMKRASRKQRIKDALKLMKTAYFQKLISSRSRSDKLYAEMRQRKTLQRPSLELMKLCQTVAKTCPEYAHEYITNMLIK